MTEVSDDDLIECLREFVRANPDDGFKTLQKRASARLGVNLPFSRIQRLTRRIREESVAEVDTRWVDPRTARLAVNAPRGTIAHDRAVAQEGVRTVHAQTDLAQAFVAACDFGIIDEVERLLQAGAPVNAVDHTGCSGLYLACQNGFLGLVPLLLRHRADVNQRAEKDSRGLTPLMEALEREFEDIAALLLKSGTVIVDLVDTSIGSTSLQLAAQKGLQGSVALLLKRAADVNIACAFDGCSALYAACERNNHIVARELLSARADIDRKSKNGWTPLHKACSSLHIESVRQLLAHRADPNLCGGPQGVTALWTSLSSAGVWEKQPMIARALLSARADIARKDKEGWTPLHRACNKLNVEAVQELLAHRADPNMRGGPDGSTVFLTAMIASHQIMEDKEKSGNEINGLRTVEMLVQHGANCAAAKAYVEQFPIRRFSG